MATASQQRKVAGNGDRRAEILDAAARVFQSKSYAGTTMQDIADEVGLLKGSLYHYIDSKEQLLYELIDETQERFFARIDEIMAEPVDGGADVRIRQIAREHVLYNAQNLERAATCYRDMRFLSPKRFKTITRRRDEHDRLLQALIKRGQTEGTIRPTLNPKIAVKALFSLVNWMYQWYRPDGQLSAEEIADQFADIALDGLH